MLPRHRVFDASTIAPILAAAVGLTGSLVAGLSVYLTYRGRHNLIRQVVYGRQLDAYFNIAAAMTALYSVAQDAVATAGFGHSGEDARTRVRAALRAEHEQFTEAVNRSLIVLPSRVKAAVDQFNEILLSACEPSVGSGPGGLEPGLAGAYERVLNSIRHHLAIDSLTSVLLREMGIGSESVALKDARVA